MTSLRKAAEKALEEWHTDPGSVRMASLMMALEAALAEPVQEPIGSDWEPCVKLPVTVHVRAQHPGETHVSTREGITPVKPDDLIMRGVSGEEYPIGRDIFERTYQRGEAPPQRKPLTQEKIWHTYKNLWMFHPAEEPRLAGDVLKFARAIERAHGIGGDE